MTAEDEPDEAMEYQIESQRGWVLLGYPFFSANLLVALDPAPFSAPDGSALGRSLDNVSVPDDTWEWTWPKWYVDMANDVDDQGWLYSWRFRSKDWTGYPRIGRSFVRQRQWKRLRRKKQEYRSQKPTAETDDDACEEVLKLIGACSDAREQVNAVSEYIHQHPERANDLRRNSKRLFGSFLLPVSEHEIMRKMAEVPSFIQNAANPFSLTDLSKPKNERNL